MVSTSGRTYFKFEGDEDANDVERVVTHYGIGWAVLDFDFTGVTGTDYTPITLIFDNGMVGDATNWTFYFDMVIPVVVKSNNIANVINFEAATDTCTFTDFNGGAATVVSNSGVAGNDSVQVGKIVKSDGEV